MDLNDVVGYTLRIGVIISIILILIGFVFLYRDKDFNELVSPYSRINTSVINPNSVPTNAFSGNGLDLILLGLMVLIATPVARVLIGIIQFARERNIIYTIITIIVFFNLMLAIFILPLFIH
ncbi:DUF1634 domain-containing protein [Sulfurisphaera ohwakuensis]|uniref:DUF1634 domain-containing protein n=1 Tax=Sulfurisphaera ohwakuensis TaxID=69656 RepID=A0A650CJI1_SULOH|nr:DUF1634 domain-containing protein [Sulfurisphaera ohwakuensis]MBB5253941.1 putative membrane protein [Sulfurisphaera ohwakuensis]QGR18001.1 DUF1634 domain-containing protein [Sulfurisphaera ohwakuensis]